MNPDWECLIRAQHSDETSCRDLIERYQSRLMALAILITGSPSAAQDIVQETFVKALDARLRDTDGTVNGFLGTIAYRLALKELKRVGRHAELNVPDQLDPGPDPLDIVLIDERDRLVAQAIRSLDKDHRDPLVLRFYGGHSYDEIAGVLNIPLGTVKSRIFIAVRTCREILREKGVLE